MTSQHAASQDTVPVSLALVPHPTRGWCERTLGCLQGQDQLRFKACLLFQADIYRSTQGHTEFRKAFARMVFANLRDRWACPFASSFVSTNTSAQQAWALSNKVLGSTAAFNILGELRGLQDSI